jgi:hypothetical protein
MRLFHWMERAYTQRDAGLYMIEFDALLKNIEGGALAGFPAQDERAAIRRQ